MSRPTNWAGDLLPIGLSGLCMIHCLALPLLAGLSPLLGVAAQAEWVHWLLALLAAPVSLWALAPGPGGTWPRGPSLLATLGVISLVCGAAGVPDHDLETLATVCGASLISVAHLLNWRRREPLCRAR